MVDLESRYNKQLQSRQITALALLDYFRGVFFRDGEEGLEEASRKLLQELGLSDKVSPLRFWEDQRDFNHLVLSYSIGLNVLDKLMEYLARDEIDAAGIYAQRERVIKILAALRGADSEAFANMAKANKLDVGPIKGPHSYKTTKEENLSAAKWFVNQLMEDLLGRYMTLSQSLGVI